MTTVDYGNYLDQQSEWAKSLSEVARTSAPESAYELGEITAETLRRMIHFGCNSQRMADNRARRSPSMLARLGEMD